MWWNMCARVIGSVVYRSFKLVFISEEWKGCGRIWSRILLMDINVYDDFTCNIKKRLTNIESKVKDREDS